jgi:hypothetical protein
MLNVDNLSIMIQTIIAIVLGLLYFWFAPAPAPAPVSVFVHFPVSLLFPLFFLLIVNHLETQIGTHVFFWDMDGVVRYGTITLHAVMADVGEFASIIDTHFDCCFFRERRLHILQLMVSTMGDSTMSWLFLFLPSIGLNRQWGVGV